jgi:predicted TIM-barrel fold metal-dependent hydrolase
MTRAGSQERVRVIDCDVHESPASPKLLKPYLAKEWHGFIESNELIPNNGYTVPIGGTRRDAVRPDGKIGSMDVEQIIWQHLDAYDITYAVLTGLLGFKFAAMPQMQLAAGLASAYNDWVMENVLSRDRRFKGSVAVAPQLPDRAAAEIDRVGGHPDIVQVALPTSSPDLPWGHPYFYPIWEAAVRNHLRIGMHLMPPTGLQGVPNGAGWPRSYMENRSQYPNLFEAQLISMVCNGVFEKFPDLGLVFLEGGFSWVPGVMWRLDQSWRSLRSEVPWLKRRPSEYIREHVRFATQPFEEPDDPKHLLHLIDMMGSDELLLFASDYPHWDFDAPVNALPSVLGKELKEKILWRNGAAFYGLPDPVSVSARSEIPATSAGS